MRIETIYPAVPAEIECDGYVPLVIRFDGYYGPDSWAPIYWRTGDFEHSLVEIGVNPSSGAICSVILVCLPGIESTALLKPTLSSTPGLPGAALYQWHAKSQSIEALVRIDCNQRVAGSLVDRELTLIFGDIASGELKGVRCDRVTFLIDTAKNLRGLQIADLSHEECENLRFTLDPPTREAAEDASVKAVSEFGGLRISLKRMLAVVAFVAIIGAAYVAMAPRSPLMQVFNSAANMEIIRMATRVEARRVHLPAGVEAPRDDLSPTDYVVAAESTQVPEPLVQILTEQLLATATYEVDAAKACGPPIYGVMLSFFRDEERVDVYFCFHCSVLAVVRDGVVQGGGDFSMANDDFVRTAKELFPDDAEIQAIR